MYITHESDWSINKCYAESCPCYFVGAYRVTARMALATPRHTRCPSDGATLKQILAAQSVLTSLILYCSDSQDLDPMNRSGVPVVRHQMLLLDMNVHSLVISLLSSPFRESGAKTAPYSLRDLQSAHNTELANTCALAYRLLQQMVRGSRAFAFSLAAYVPFMLSQMGYCRLAADTLSEMFHNNRLLLEQV